MAYDLNGRALFLLSELIEQADFPLSDYLPASSVSALFEGLYYTEASMWASDANLVLEVQLVWAGELVLSPPGCDAFSLVLAAGGTGLSTMLVEIVLGPDFAMTWNEATAVLRVSEDVLRDVATGGPAEIALSGNLTISPSGITLGNFSGGSLAPAYLCGTLIEVEAAGVVPVFGEVQRPLYATPDFSGLAIDSLTVRVPSAYLTLDGGGTLEFVLEKGTIGNTGFSGAVSAAWSSTDAEPQPAGRFLGFPFRFREFSLEIEQNAIIAASLAIDIRLEELESGGAEKWIGLEVAFGSEGSFSATADATVVFEFAKVLRLTATRFRLQEEDGLWTFYLSGSAALLLEGMDGPELSFTDFGITSAGDFRMPEGGGIALDSPVIVQWHFVRLTLTKLRFGHSEADPNKLMLGLSAEVMLMEGLPAGASVEGMVAEWDPRAGGLPDVRFDGIGLSFGEPGSFTASLKVGYQNSSSGIEFRGTGSLALSALDMEISIGVVVGQDTVEGFTYLYLFADAKLLPTGIPIAQTGLSIYGFQGLLAYNMALNVDEAVAADERYYRLFSQDPIGITAVSKWVKREGQNALGFGIVIGTLDRGFMVHTKGMLVVAFPDLTILLQAKADFLKVKPTLGDTSEGSLDALLVYASGDASLSLDIAAQWSLAPAYAVEGTARAFFSFEDLSAWYLEIGQDKDGKRVTAQAIQWGSNWLFSAGFWFRLDNDGLVTGAQLDVALRADSGGFWAEASGTAKGEMGLAWEPLQWEGMVSLTARIGAGYKGVSVSATFNGTARARLHKPFDVLITVSACVKAALWEICHTFDFSWQAPDPPVLELALRTGAATPMNWTARQSGDSETPELDTGVVSLSLSATSTQVIQPHSCLSLAFAKPMVDDTGAFNEAAALGDGGYLTIGSGSGYSAAYHLTSLSLVRDPDGAAEPFTVWGTWEQDTLEQNTVLNLFSSERFGDDGSLTSSYISSIVINYCEEPTQSRRCVSFDDVEPGFGRLPDGSLYRWVQGVSPVIGTTGGQGIVLGLADKLRFRINAPVERIFIDAESLPGFIPETKTFAVNKSANGLFDATILNWRLLRLCYKQGHHGRRFSLTARSGGALTGNEAWSVPESAQILPPNETFELRVEHTAVLKAPDGAEDAPLVTTTVARFKTAGPPDYEGALTDYVAATYPSDGARPVYTGYDLAVTFLQEYVPYLYTAAGSRLVYRLFDAEGRLVTDGQGGMELTPALFNGPAEQSVTMSYWQAVYEENVQRGCVDEVTFETDANTVLRLDSLALLPNTRYVAQLVSEQQPSVPLLTWGFTTSRHATFTELANTSREIAASRRAAAALGGSDFDGVARSLGAATIAYVEHVTVTPWLDAAGSACVALLIEAPEPLDFKTRLTIKVHGRATDVWANGDSTRGFVTPRGGATWPLRLLRVEFTWVRDAGESLPKLSVAGDLSAEVVDFSVDPREAL
jgi:hypothetical protein